MLGMAIGYVTAQGQIQDNLIAAQQLAIKAQQDLDAERRDKARVLSELAAERRVRGAADVKSILAKLDALPKPIVINADGVCMITPEAIRLLNEAGNVP